MTTEEVKEFIRSMDADAFRQLLTIRELIREGKIQHDFENSYLICFDEDTRKFIANGCQGEDLQDISEDMQTDAMVYSPEWSPDELHE